MNAGHDKKPQPLYLDALYALGEEDKAGHCEHMLGNAHHEGEEVAECAHDIPLVPHPGEGVVPIPGV